MQVNSDLLRSLKCLQRLFEWLFELAALLLKGFLLRSPVCLSEEEQNFMQIRYSLCVGCNMMVGCSVDHLMYQKVRKNVF